MNIPRYWSKAIASETDRRGKPLQFTCWRGSNRSPEDARELAAQGARNIINRILRGETIGQYAYADKPLREEILHELTDENGNLTALLTRNASGAVILNTSGVMFVDVDFPPASLADDFAAMFRFLFRRPGPSRSEREQTKALRRAEDFLAEKPGFGFRAYRTCWGMRLLATHDIFDPADQATMQLLEALGADPLYVKLCRIQQCFRARLTPKPWRCGSAVNKIRYPREDAEKEALFAQWKKAYEMSSGYYATCRYLGAMGNDAVHPAIEKIISLHDNITRAHESLKLA